MLTQGGNMKTDHLMEDSRKLTKVCSDLVTNVQMCLVDSIKSSSKSKESPSESDGIK